MTVTSLAFRLLRSVCLFVLRGDNLQTPQAMLLPVQRVSTSRKRVRRSASVALPARSAVARMQSRARRTVKRARPASIRPHRRRHRALHVQRADLDTQVMLRATPKRIARYACLAHFPRLGRLCALPALQASLPRVLARHHATNVHAVGSKARQGKPNVQLAQLARRTR